MSSVELPCSICIEKPAARPMPRMGGGCMATTVAFFIPALATRFFMASIMPCTLVCGVVRSSQGVNMQNIVPLLLPPPPSILRSEEHTSELQSHSDLVCRLLLE